MWYKENSINRKTSVLRRNEFQSVKTDNIVLAIPDGKYGRKSNISYVN